MAVDNGDSRTVLQAHKLRSNLAADALIHGDAKNRGRTMTVRLLVISLIIAAVIVGGIVITGYVIDLIAARQR